MDPTLASTLRIQNGLKSFPRLHWTAIGVSWGYGLTIPLFGFVVLVYRSRGFKTKAAQLTALASGVCFILWTVYLALSMRIAFNGFRLLNDIAARNGDYSSAVEYNDSNIPICWLQNILTTISDVVVLGRALVLFDGRRWIIHILLFLWLIYMGISVPVCVFGLVGHASKIQAIRGRLNDAFNYMSLGLNIIATMLLGWKLWTFTSLHKNGDKISKLVPQVGGKILAVLTEAGALLCCFMLLCIVTSAVNDSMSRDSRRIDLAIRVLAQLLTALWAVYPSLITVLAYFQKSVTESAHLASLSIR